MLWRLIWCCLFIVMMSNCMYHLVHPTTLCDVLLCHVMCSHPPRAWDSHLVVVLVVGVCQDVQLFQFFGGSCYDFVKFLIWFFCYHFHPALLQTLCLGNATHPPTFPKDHMLYIQFTHRNLYPPMCLIPALSHPYCTYSDTQPPTHSNPRTH